jgi:Skp family chaperone for outer membrane proteins
MITRLQRILLAMTLLVSGVVAGAAISISNEAHGEIRATPTPQSFQTGGQLSVPILKEIAATLRQIDSRLSRLETVAQKLQSPRSSVQQSGN